MPNNKKNKKYSKSFIMVGINKVCIEDLVDAVNKADKAYGIRLKHPEIWSEPYNFVDIITAKANLNLAALICSVNGIPISKYFDTDTETGYGTICKPVDVNDSLFMYMSILEWNNKKDVYNTDSLIFRCRFLTLVMLEVIGRIDDIAYREFKEKYDYRHSKSEKRIVITRDIMNDIIRFILVLMNTKSSYKNIILLMNEHLSYTKKKVDHTELRNLINGHVLNTRKGMEENLFSERFLDDDLAIYNILKISYMLATNKTNVKVIPKFKHIEGATVKHDLIKLIEELGSQIIYNSKDRKYSPMFMSFIKARPSVWSQFYKEDKENYAIHIGLLSLAYTKFIFNDKNMDKFIDEMMKKGI